MDSIGFAAVIAEEERTGRTELKVQRQILRDASNPLAMDDEMFKKNFRLNKSVFLYVLDRLESQLPSPVRSFSISSVGQLAGLLRFLAEGGYQYGVGKDHDVEMAQSTMSRTIKNCLNILERTLCPEWIQLKMTDMAKTQAKLDFYSQCGFPGVMMCVDGTHIKIIKPHREAFLYYNRKGYYSLNVMLLYDYKMRIRYVDARFPGCNHDSHIWNLSAARSFFQKQFVRGREINTWVLGDAGYPLGPWLITPFRSPGEGTPESRFNTKHSRTRNIVERTIGVLKNRFRCLLSARELHYAPCKAVQIVNVACALQNFCIHFGVEECLEADVMQTPEKHEIEVQLPSNFTNEANRIRDQILRTL